MSEQQSEKDIAALAKGGRTNFFGFLLRLAARLPFLFIAGRLYGADALGRFASALVMVELFGQVCALGQKRGLAQWLSHAEGENEANIVADGLFLAGLFATLAALGLYAFPWPMFPSGQFTDTDRLLAFSIIPLALTEVALAAQAYRYDVATTVRARAVVEPWTISIMAGVMFFILPGSGLAIAYLLSVIAALVTAAVPMIRQYGLPRQWLPHPARLAGVTRQSLPLATADAIEWGTRRVDIAILGYFASPATVGIYYVAQQVASLPQKLKTSFEPILGPVITRNLKQKNYAAISRQVCQVGFWITAAQAGIALALGIPGEGVMGLVGPHFVAGTGALAFLLSAEVVAATAVVAEAALVYMARMRNLALSVGTIALQAALTLAALFLLEREGASELVMAAAAAAALMVALGVASLLKAGMLARMLGHPVNNWRWALVYAIAPAVLVGWLATRLPEWAELLFGIPAILLTYGWVIWRRGFGPEDRVLFRKNVHHEDNDLSGTASAG
jgi:O-antigen/teichoic acid export membrane protein